MDELLEPIFEEICAEYYFHFTMFGKHIGQIQVKPINSLLLSEAKYWNGCQ